MKYFAGLDVSMAETSVCIVDQDGAVIRPEVTKGPDFTHKRTNHELRRPCESIGRVPQRGGESVTVFPGRSLGAPDTAAPARRLSAAPSASSAQP